MNKPVVIGLSIGTALLFSIGVCVLAAAIVLGGSNLRTEELSVRPFQPKTGVMSELHRLKNEMDYGPVNLDAAKAVKNGGGLLARIHQNRQAVCPPCPPCPVPSYQQSFQVVSACQFPQSTRPIVMDPTDCNFGYVAASTSPQSLIIQQTGLQPAGVEMPSVAPSADALSKLLEKDCPTCKKDPRSELKTGSFICSNCRKAQVGNWHTDWNDDGQPITFLCESCYSNMSPEQRDKAYRGYIARQTKTVGQIGLLHPELGK